jgi:integrase
MASVSQRVRASGSVQIRLSYRLDGKPKTLDFDTQGEAEHWAGVFNDLGAAEGLVAYKRHLAIALGEDPDLLARKAEAAAKAAAEVEVAAARPVCTVRIAVTKHIVTSTKAGQGTKDTYLREAERDIFPYLGDLDVNALIDVENDWWAEDEAGGQTDSLTGSDIIKGWVNDLRAGRRADPNAGKVLAHKTVWNRLMLLASGMNWAVRKHVVPHNPCTGIEVPGGSIKRMVFLEKEGFAKLLRFIDPFWHPFIWFLVLTGARFSEANAITVADVDLKGRKIFITKAHKFDRSTNELLIGPTKSANSRWVPVSDLLEELLREQVAGKKPGDLLFTNRAGLVIRNNSFHSRIWQKALRQAIKAGVLSEETKPRVHDLRHTFATWSLADGWDMYELARVMGHADLRMIQKVYGHSSVQAMQQALDATNRTAESMRSHLRLIVTGDTDFARAVEVTDTEDIVEPEDHEDTELRLVSGQ